MPARPTRRQRGSASATSLRPRSRGRRPSRSDRELREAARSRAPTRRGNLPASSGARRQALAKGPSRDGAPLTIVMVGWEYPPFHTGGLGVHCQELSRELGRLGHHVLFLTPFDLPYEGAPGVEFLSPGRAGSDEIARISAYGVPEFHRAEFQTLVEAYNDWVGRLRIPGADIVHVHDWFGTEGGARLARRLRVPLVMTMHSTELDRSLGHPHEPIFERERFGVRNADAIIAVSRHLAEQLVLRYGAPRQRVHVVYNAVRPAGEPARPARRGDLVLFLGRLTAMKGPDTFLRAAARIADDFPEVRFAIAGEGPEYPHLVRLSAELGIGDRVLFFGKVSEEERAALLHDAAVYVLPSVVEPFGISALEAMAAGVPTIVSKTSGVAEVIDAAFQVDFWDIDEFASRIAELLEYPPLREEMGEHGRTEATNESWADRARETVAIYRGLHREVR